MVRPAFQKPAKCIRIGVSWLGIETSEDYEDRNTTGMARNGLAWRVFDMQGFFFGVSRTVFFLGGDQMIQFQLANISVIIVWEAKSKVKIIQKSQCQR